MIYLDEETGIYYDAAGNKIEFNPDDYLIEKVEDVLENPDGPPDAVAVTLQPPASVVGSERPKSAVSRPKSAVNSRI